MGRNLLLIALTCAVIMSGCSGGTKTARLNIIDRIDHKGETSVQRNGLRGAVRSVRTTKADFVMKSARLTQQRPWLFIVKSYTKEGKFTYEAGYRPDGSCLFRIAIARNSEGKAIGRTDFRRGKLRREEYKLDSQGHISEVMMYGPGNVFSGRKVCTLDRDGNATRVVSYGADGEKESTMIQKFDADGHTTEQASQNPEGREMSREIRRDDPNGNGEFVQYYEGKLQQRWIDTTFGNGRGFRETRYNADGSIRGSSARRYDSNWYLAEDIRYTAKGTMQRRDVFTNDPRGNHLSKAHYGPGNVLVSKKIYRYQYDAMGNWIKRVALSPKSLRGKSTLQPVEVQYRKITYWN